MNPYSRAASYLPTPIGGKVSSTSLTIDGIFICMRCYNGTTPYIIGAYALSTPPEASVCFSTLSPSGRPKS